MAAVPYCVPFTPAGPFSRFWPSGAPPARSKAPPARFEAPPARSGAPPDKLKEDALQAFRLSMAAVGEYMTDCNGMFIVGQHEKLVRAVNWTDQLHSDWMGAGDALSFGRSVTWDCAERCLHLSMELIRLMPDVCPPSRATPKLNKLIVYYSQTQSASKLGTASAWRASCNKPSLLQQYDEANSLFLSALDLLDNERNRLYSVMGWTDDQYRVWKSAVQEATQPGATTSCLHLAVRDTTDLLLKTRAICRQGQARVE